MKINVTQTIKGYDGQPIMDGGAPATLRGLMIYSLNSFQVDERPSPEDKAACYALSVKLYGADTVDLSLDERTLLKKRAGLMLKPVSMGPVVAALEDPSAEAGTK